MTGSRQRVVAANNDTRFSSSCVICSQGKLVREVHLLRVGRRPYGFIEERVPHLVILDMRMGGEERRCTILNLLTRSRDPADSHHRVFGRDSLVPASSPGPTNSASAHCRIPSISKGRIPAAPGFPHGHVANQQAHALGDSPPAGREPTWEAAGWLALMWRQAGARHALLAQHHRKIDTDDGVQRRRSRRSSRARRPARLLRTR